MSGVPGSPGCAVAPAYIVRSPDDFAACPAGAILVVRATTPAWTALFARAAGIIAESGGPLSHGAIAAREQGIPAVMAVRDAMMRLVNGQIAAAGRVTRDGRAGRGVNWPAPASRRNESGAPSRERRLFRHRVRRRVRHRRHHPHRPVLPQRGRALGRPVAAPPPPAPCGRGRPPGPSACAAAPSPAGRGAAPGARSGWPGPCRRTRRTPAGWPGPSAARPTGRIRRTRAARGVAATPTGPPRPRRTPTGNSSTRDPVGARALREQDQAVARVQPRPHVVPFLHGVVRAPADEHGAAQPGDGADQRPGPDLPAWRRSRLPACRPGSGCPARRNGWTRTPPGAHPAAARACRSRGPASPSAGTGWPSRTARPRPCPAPAAAGIPPCTSIIGRVHSRMDAPRRTARTGRRPEKRGASGEGGTVIKPGWRTRRRGSFMASRYSSVHGGTTTAA